MNHLSLVVGTHDPVVRAEVKVVGVGDFLRVADLDLGRLDPLSHLHIQV
jgi:hypothetical protein